MKLVYKVYNSEPKCIGQYAENGEATRAMRNHTGMAVVAKEGVVLAYKSGMSTREQSRIRDTIAEQYEEEQNREDPEDDESEQDFEDIEDAEDNGEPEDSEETETETKSKASTEPSTTATVTVPTCNNPNKKCIRPAKPVTERARPEMRGLCKQCQDAIYTRIAQAKPKNDEALERVRKLSAEIASLLSQYRITRTDHEQEYIDLGKTIGLDILRAMAKRVQSHD